MRKHGELRFLPGFERNLKAPTGAMRPGGGFEMVGLSQSVSQSVVECVIGSSVTDCEASKVRVSEVLLKTKTS